MTYVFYGTEDFLIKQELSKLKEKYNIDDISISYYDLNLGFEYKYNENIKYYAASTMKSLAALYIYDKAWNDEINLDDTITYTSKYKWGASKFMQSHKYGDAITIRELVKYSVIVSDNSSYQMLVDYIGKSNLREYGKSLGASLTMSGSDNFGYIDVNDGIIYMKAINDFINNFTNFKNGISKVTNADATKKFLLIFTVFIAP